MKKYRRFGRTELNCAGDFLRAGVRYQFKWDDMPLEKIADNQANLEACSHHYAVELGINHIETLRGYGTSRNAV